MKSMTAFARRDRDTPWGWVVMELRTINHRYLDLHIKLPELLRAAEPALRKRIGGVIRRGRVDVLVYLDNRADSEHRQAPPQLELDRELVRALNHVGEQLRELVPQVGAPNAGDLLRWPGVVKHTTADRTALSAAVLELCGEALAEVDAERSREGGEIQALLVGHAGHIEDITQQVAELLPGLEARRRARLMEQLGEAAQQISPGAVEQELLQFLQKSDVSEEMERIGIHLRALRARLNADSAEPAEAVGRHLDFLMQELHREANTLGAKSVDGRVSELSVQLRVLIERVREQVQNIE